MNQDALHITKALAFTENGGQPDVNNTKAGKTGEMKSIFQFEPDTWKAYSRQITGKDLALTPENESAVAYGKVSKWLEQGYTAPQIASMWNAGVGEPNAYTGKFSDGTSSKGTNHKYGVSYDVPGYVEKFNKYLSDSQGSEELPQGTDGDTTQNTPTSTSQLTQSSKPVQVENQATSVVPEKVNPPQNTGLVPHVVNKKLGSLNKNVPNATDNFKPTQKKGNRYANRNKNYR